LKIVVDTEVALKVLEEQDADKLFAYIDSHRLYLRQWLPWVDNERSSADTRLFIQLVQQQFQSHEGFQTGIWYKNDLVGVIGYHRFDWVNRSTSIGYWLTESHQGRGIMTRSCKALVDHAFQELNLHRVEIRCAVENKRSRAIPERLGFTTEGVAREAEWLYDHYVDLVIYSMLTREWRERKRILG
jgi:ribosomal-protein-serine acetyltransferase